LRQAHPQARITFLGSSWVRDVLEQVPFVDEVLFFDAPLAKVSRARKLAATLRLILGLRRARFDAALIAHRSPFFALLLCLAGVRTRVGFGGKFLTRGAAFDEGEHEITRYGALSALLDAPLESTATHLRPHAEETETIARALRQAGIGDDERIIGLFPGGGENPGTTMTIKRWSAPQWGALCDRLAPAWRGRIVLIGGPNDRALNDEVLRCTAAPVVNLAGATSLRALPALLARCEIVAGGDTGPLHIAAAVGARTLFLFGPSDPRLVAPLQSDSRFLWTQPPCSPCYTPASVLLKSSFQGTVFGCHTGTHECLADLSVSAVFDALADWL